MHAAPLLEEECHFFSTTKLQKSLNPTAVHWARSIATFASDYRPIYSGDIEFPNIL